MTEAQLFVSCEMIFSKAFASGKTRGRGLAPVSCLFVGVINISCPQVIALAIVGAAYGSEVFQADLLQFLPPAIG